MVYVRIYNKLLSMPTTPLVGDEVTIRDYTPRLKITVGKRSWDQEEIAGAGLQWVLDVTPIGD